MTAFKLSLPQTRLFASCAILAAMMLLSAPVWAGDAVVDTDGPAAVIILDEEGNAVSTTDEAELVIMPDGAMLIEEVITTDEVAADAAQEKGGFPQLDTSTYSSQVFWLFISFALLYLLMSRLALPRITEVIDLRQTQINCNLDRAATINDEAQKARDAFQAILTDAQDNARTAISTVEQKAAERHAQDAARFAEHARGRVATAEAAIAQARADAMHSLADISAEVAADMANKVGRLHLSKADALPTVKSLLNKA